MSTHETDCDSDNHPWNSDPKGWRTCTECGAKEPSDHEPGYNDSDSCSICHGDSCNC